MKLRNKKTGEIMDDVQYRNYSLSDGFGLRMNGKEWEYHSLAELNEEWEDYEEPKGSVLDIMILTLTNLIENEPDEDMVDLEDCKKMLEKLKAWKRLRDKGFRFKMWEYDDRYATEFPCILIRANKIKNCEEDLDLLFSGEDD